MLLGLFAPFVTEHLYQRFYAAHEDAGSLHLSRWPAADPAWRSDRQAVDPLAVILDATRALRGDAPHPSGVADVTVAITRYNGSAAPAAPRR